MTTSKGGGRIVLPILKEVAKMAHRSTVAKRIDRKVFKHTAASTKRMNVAPKVRRGGIRL